MPIRTPRFGFTTSSTAPKRMSFKEEYGSEWKKLRKRRLEAEPLCRHCQVNGHITAAKQVDHILPLALGGKHEWENTQSLCVACHRAKTHEDMKLMPRA